MKLESRKLPKLYLDLMKNCLTRYISPRPTGRCIITFCDKKYRVVHLSLLRAILEKKGLRLYRDATVDLERRAEGRDWPADAETMIGLKRLNNLQSCIRQVLRDEVPGDFIEAGVWRGGASIFMRAALKAYTDDTRQVWVVDSFEGLPKPDGRFQQDEGDRHWKKSDFLGISLDQVKANFSRYGLLDDRVRFLKGWFKDTLPTAPIERLSILRLDGDMYASTMDSLQNLYPKLSAGGYTIIDDYGEILSCRQAVDDFRAANQIETPVIPIDLGGVYWQKQA